MIILEGGECEHCKKLAKPLYEVIGMQGLKCRLCESCSMILSEIKANKVD